MTFKLKPCPVCGNRVTILRHCIENMKGGRDRIYYSFSHHPLPFGFCIIATVLDGKRFSKPQMENYAKIWNIRDEECHTIGHLSEVEKVDIE